MDLKAIGEDIGLDEEEFLEIVELFLETAQTDIDRLRHALSSGDIQSINEAAHSLKGSAGNLGFMEIYRLSKEIESATRQNTLEHIGPVLESIEKVKETIQAALSAGTA
jgi:HPt (histidine-containing phosphotransfer) domain-containing protein